MQKQSYWAGIIALALTGVAGAQAVDDEPVTQLERILVTEGLTPIEQEKSGRAFTVITGEQLQQNQVRYVADALRLVPGFSVSRSGSFGGPTQVRVRGAEANHLLVMIDGVEVSETSTGEFDFASLLADDVDRIEVLRGPQSAFWGSNATAGVVNIITRRGERNGFKIGGRSEVGTDGTFLGGVSLSGGAENFDMALSGTFRRTDGFNISDFGSEKDGDRNVTLNGKFTADITPDLVVDGTLRYVDRESDIDPQDFNSGGAPDYAPGPFYGLVVDGNDWTRTQELFGSLGLTHKALDGAFTQKLRLTGSDGTRDNFSDGMLSFSDGSRYTGAYQATYQFDTPTLLEARHQFTGGYEWERETFAPSHLDETFERETNSIVGEYRGEFLDQLYLNAGIRRDFNDRFGDATTYSLSGAWRIPGSETRLHASVGTGVTNPTFFEQYGFVPSSFEGNASLTPEKSFGWDIGVEHRFFDGRLIADVTYFNQDLTDEIAVVFGGPPDFLSSPVNREGKSKRQGVEVSATVDLFNGFTATASYTYTDATEQTRAGGPRLDEIRRPRHSGSIGAAYTFYDDRARVFGEAVFNGKTEDVAFVPTLPSRVWLDAYTVVNIGGSLKFSDQLEGFARVENLFDEQYEEVFGYNTQGRTAFVGIKGAF
ncbi:TonB-dependent receptor plug domain-containing protein [Arvimicrobium flavum]|uniref:TonB-dependent receptor plug domain-containing protein n=1 Tax=Arvimicrobium flavum TaxID=3393320 RepID=UPI00237A5C57|nr:TonB-dependent receptor [Mesorhizobium shangrilense]